MSIDPFIIVEEKSMDPSFTGSTDSIAKEMPLEVYEEAVQDDMSDEGFQVFGDFDGTAEV